MICTFKSKETAQIFRRQPVKRFDGIRQPALTRLLRLDAARTLADLQAISGNRLEALKRNRRGQHCIRINDQWRICFRWIEATGAHDVEIVDYH